MVTRINGFSGMDIDSLVKSLMSAKRVPLDKMGQSKQTIQWQRESYRELNSTLYDWRNNKLSVLGTGYRASASLNAQVASIKDSSGAVVSDINNSAVKAEATAEANGIPMTVTVKRLASSASVESAAKSNVKTSMTLAQISGKSDTKFTFTNGTETMSFDNTDSLSTVISKINANSKLDVKASFDDLTGKFVLTSKKLGEDSKINLETSDFSNSNSLLTMFDTADNWSTKSSSAQGQTAIYSINGSADMELKNSNSVIHNGVKLTFQNVTGSWTDSSGNIKADPANDDRSLTISTQVDTTKALTTIKSFIEDYNKMISNLNDQINEEKYRDFPPLTNEQRSSMSESDITAWEKKAKSGLMKNDPMIKELLGSMRATISDQMGALSSLGVTTGRYFENGKLYLDEDKFKKALEANPQQAIDVFQGTAGNTSQSIFGKFAEAANSAMVKISERAGTSRFDGSLTATFKPESVIGRQLKNYDSQIARLTSQLNTAETRYYKQFSAMETAMNKYQSQLAQLTGGSAS